jgi:O-Antigen ligase
MDSYPDIKTLFSRVFLPLLLAVALVVVAVRGGSYDDVARGEAFFAVWWVLGLGVSFGVLPGALPSRSAWLAVGSLVALAGWMALGATWSESVGRTLHEASRTLGFAGILLVVVATFGSDWRRAAGALTATMIVVCCLALTSRLAPDLLSSTLQQSGYVGKRLSYPFNYWNAIGAWAAMTVGLALAWSAHAHHRWSRAAALGGVCVAVPVVYLTYSRGSVAAVLIAAVAVIGLSRHRWLAALHAVLAASCSAVVIVVIRADPAIALGTGAAGAGTVLAILGPIALACLAGAYVSVVHGVENVRLAPRAARGVAASVAVIAALAAAAFGPALAERAGDSFAQQQKVDVPADPAQRFTNLSGQRRVLWSAALEAFGHHPLDGLGAGTYEFLWNRDKRWTNHVVDAHSLYFELLAETGLVGALLALAALGASLRAAVLAPFRQRDAAPAGAAAGCAAALAVFCFSAGVDWMWESTAVAAVAFVCAGLGLAAAAHPASDVAVPDPVAERRGPHRMAIGLLALAALALQTPALVAASEIGASQEAVRDGRNADAVTAASVAVHAEPWNASAYLQRALVLERQGFLDAAADDARTAAGKQSTNSEMWLILGRIEVERGRVAAALAAVRKARELNPRNPVFRSKAGP